MDIFNKKKVKELENQIRILESTNINLKNEISRYKKQRNRLEQ